MGDVYMQGQEILAAQRIALDTPSEPQTAPRFRLVGEPLTPGEIRALPGHDLPFPHLTGNEPYTDIIHVGNGEGDDAYYAVTFAVPPEENAAEEPAP